MIKRRFLILLFVALLICGLGLSINGATLAQTGSDDFPPIIFISQTEILRWTGGDQIEFVANMPQPANQLRLVWDNAMVSPDRQSVAYMVRTPEWQTLVENDAVRDGDHAGSNIYLVDIASGQTKAIALQETAEPRSQIARWGLHWTPDSQSLIWMEDTDAGNVIRYDFATNTVTTLVQNAAPYFSSLQTNVENRIIVSDLNEGNRTNNYTIYDLNGTFISYIASLDTSESSPYSYLIIEGETPFLSTNLERINLADGTVSPMPFGRLLEISATAPDTSLRITPATFGSAGCTSDILNSDGQFLARIPVNNVTFFSPDGSAILYRDSDTALFFILQVDESGNFNHIELPRITDSAVYVVAWGAKANIFEAGGDSFNGRFSCAAG